MEPVDPTVVSETLEELASDVEIAAVHVGMLGSARVAKAVAEFLTTRPADKLNGAPTSKPAKARFPNIVVDPVLKSSSGANLLDTNARKLLIERLIPLADVLTPNIEEAAVLTGLKVTELDEMKGAAMKLQELGASAVVITGGHLDKAIDVLSFSTAKGIEQEVFKAERQQSNSTHGTGCAFATGMACHLALNRGVAEATLLAKIYVNAAISYGHPLGRGIGPVHHLYRMGQQRRAAVSGSEP